jgi:hypothetical protein
VRPFGKPAELQRMLVVERDVDPVNGAGHGAMLHVSTRPVKALRGC